MKDASAEYIPTRRSLLTRLKRWDDQESWRVFFDTYGKLVYNFSRRSGLPDAEAQEVVQETVISVAKQMPGFHYDPTRGSFKSWLMQITRRRITDQLRKRPREFRLPEPGSATGTAAEARVPDPAGVELERLWEHEWQKTMVESALQKLKKRTNPAQYQLFELTVIKEWPVERITKTLGVSSNQVYLAKGRIGKLLQAELKRMQSRLG